MPLNGLIEKIKNTLLTPLVSPQIEYWVLPRTRHTELVHFLSQKNGESSSGSGVREGIVYSEINCLELEIFKIINRWLEHGASLNHAVKVGRVYIIRWTLARKNYWSSSPITKVWQKLRNCSKQSMHFCRVINNTCNIQLCSRTTIIFIFTSRKVWNILLNYYYIHTYTILIMITCGFRKAYYIAFNEDIDTKYIWQYWLLSLIHNWHHGAVGGSFKCTWT